MAIERRCATSVLSRSTLPSLSLTDTFDDCILRSRIVGYWIALHFSSQEYED